MKQTVSEEAFSSDDICLGNEVFFTHPETGEETSGTIEHLQFPDVSLVSPDGKETLWVHYSYITSLKKARD